MTSGNDIAVYDGGQLDAYRPQVMTPEAAKALDEQVRLCTKAVLREGTDYGVIPGTGEKTLWRPGAQKLLQWFQLGFTCERVDIERDSDGRKHGITYRAIVTKRGTGEVLATCEGTADYDESKFYQSAEEVQRKAEANERKWAKKDGRVADPTKWKNRGEWRADWNALMKRAQKRAIVGAASDAAAAGGIFSDREEDDSPAFQDGDLSWYERALGDALAVTSKEEGRLLYAEAAQAKRSGEATRAQADHIQNRIRQRIEQLETHIQVDVENLTPDTPPDASPAQAAPPTTAAEPPTPPAGAGEAPRKDDPAWRIVQHFERLGVTDRNDRLILTAQVARLDDVPASTTKLTPAKQREVLKIVEKCRDLDALHALLGTGETADGG
jgi:hypothetical protein